MYAVIATGRQAVRVTKDGVPARQKARRRAGRHGPSSAKVLLVGEGADVKLGKPTVKGGKVLATVVRHGQERQGVGRQVQAARAYLRQKKSPTAVHRVRSRTSAPLSAYTFLGTLKSWHTKRQAAVQERPRLTPKRLGVKRFGGEQCARGNIIVRQRGTQVRPGSNSVWARTIRLFAKVTGKVQFQKKGARAAPLCECAAGDAREGLNHARRAAQNRTVASTP